MSSPIRITNAVKVTNLVPILNPVRVSNHVAPSPQTAELEQSPTVPSPTKPRRRSKSKPASPTKAHI